MSKLVHVGGLKDADCLEVDDQAQRVAYVVDEVHVTSDGAIEVEIYNRVSWTVGGGSPVSFFLYEKGVESEALACLLHAYAVNAPESDS